MNFGWIFIQILVLRTIECKRAHRNIVYTHAKCTRQMKRRKKQLNNRATTTKRIALYYIVRQQEKHGIEIIVVTHREVSL